MFPHLLFKGCNYK